MADPRQFDGPLDKRAMREDRRYMVQLLRSSFCTRVPDADPADLRANRGIMEKVQPLPGDMGHRWTHLYEPRSFKMAERAGKVVKPVSFDAGSCALWVSPLGWRVLECWQHDDPTYGLNIVVFDPWGDIHAQVTECGAPYSWVEANLP